TRKPQLAMCQSVPSVQRSGNYSSSGTTSNSNGFKNFRQVNQLTKKGEFVNENHGLVTYVRGLWRSATLGPIAKNLVKEREREREREREKEREKERERAKPNNLIKKV